MNTISIDRLWTKLKSKRYRDQFVSAQARRVFAFQLRAIMKRRGLSQEKLAEQAGLTQGVISRAADPNYGKLTTTVMVKIANGLDMAYCGMFVPFTKAVQWASSLSDESVQVLTFVEEQAELAQIQAKLGEVPLSVQSMQSDFDGGLKRSRHRALDTAMAIGNWEQLQSHRGA